MKTVSKIIPVVVTCVLTVLVLNLAQPVWSKVIYSEQGVEIISTGDQAELQASERSDRIEQIKSLFTESALTVLVILIFAVFFGVSLYLALGVILLAFFGGIGGK